MRGVALKLQQDPDRYETLKNAMRELLRKLMLDSRGGISQQASATATTTLLRSHDQIGEQEADASIGRLASLP